VEAFLSVRLGLRSRNYFGEGGSFNEGGSKGGILEPVSLKIKQPRFLTEPRLFN